MFSPSPFKALRPLIVITFTLLSACSTQGESQMMDGPGGDGPMHGGMNTSISAPYVGRSPIVDGSAGDEAWMASPEIRGRAQEGHGGGAISFSMRVVHDDARVYFLFQWEDGSPSTRKGEWIFDGSAWTKSKEDEDRLALIVLPLDNLGSGAMGQGMMNASCVQFCHEYANPPYMATNSPDDYAEVWHWKAARTNPMGYADDQFIQNVVDSSSGETTGRRSDSGSSSYAANGDAAPEFMPSDGGLFITPDNAAPFNQAAGWKAGDTIPGYILRNPSGSRADVSARGIHKNGRWTLEMSRAKITSGSSEDMAILDGGSYNFSVAIWDNAHEDAHYKSPVQIISFSR